MPSKASPDKTMPHETNSGEVLATEIHPNDERVLVFAPYGREAQLVCTLLKQEGLGGVACNTTDEFQLELTQGAGVALPTEEALTKETLGRLEGFLMDELARLKTNKPDASELSELTNRECQVLERIAAGKSNEEICAELGLVTQTVRPYTANVYSKLGVHSRAEAVIWARERGLVRL